MNARVYCASLLILTTIAGVTLGQPNFVDVSASDVLIVTHDSLLTPNWYPGMVGAWETSMLSSKDAQDLSVSLYSIGNLKASNEISTYIENNSGLNRFVLIVGDANRDEFQDENSPIAPLSDASLGNFVPFCIEPVDPGVFYWDSYAVEHDLCYIEHDSRLSVGRIPADSRAELVRYFSKVESYVSQNNPTWAQKELLTCDDVSWPWTGINGQSVRAFARNIEEDAPQDWTIESLFVSEIGDQSERDTAFQEAVNSDVGIVLAVGVASHLDNLNWFVQSTSPFDFSNSEAFPLLLGFNCSIGAIQRPPFANCVVERLLFAEESGIIAAVAPSNWTLHRANIALANKAQDLLIKDNVRTFGALWKSLVELQDSSGRWAEIPDCLFKNIVLLGDPSLRYPLGIEPCGNWTLDASPVIIDSTLHIPSHCTLTIEAGVEVLFDNDARLVVDDSAKLVVNGTSANPVIFKAKDAGEKWIDIFVDGGALDMDHAKIYNAKSSCVYTDDPWEQGNSTPVLIQNTFMHGGGLSSGAPALKLWGSPSYTQKVTSCVVDSVPSGVGLYLYNCYVDFDLDTIRNCSYINSYIKTVSGSFRNCVFKDRVSNYGVLFQSATCNPNITCSEFTNLAAKTGSFKTTIYSSSGCSPTFAGTTVETGRSNVITDSSAYLLTVEGIGQKPTLVKNDWIQTAGSGKFMEWKSYTGAPGAYDVDNQYWNSIPSTAKFTPSIAGYWDWTPTSGSAYNVCGGDGGGSIVAPGEDIADRKGSLDDQTWEELLAEAMEMESNEEFENARAAFESLALSAESNDIRWRAMLGVITSDVKCNSSSNSIISVLDSVQALDGGEYQANVNHDRLLYSYNLKRSTRKH